MSVSHLFDLAGKTALAMQFAVLHGGAFPGGILWGDIGTNRDAGERAADISPDEVVRSVLLKWEAQLGGAGASGRPAEAWRRNGPSPGRQLRPSRGLSWLAPSSGVSRRKPIS